MFRRRFWLLMAAVVLTVVPLAATAGLGLYVRSGLYAAVVAGRMSDFLGTHVEIGEVVPLDYQRHELRDVAVYLKDTFRPMFRCRTAIVHMGGRMDLELHGGLVEAHGDEWTLDTLARAIEVALAHDFSRTDLRAIDLRDMNLVLRHGPMRLLAGQASGRIEFEDGGGRIDLICQTLNGSAPAEPVRIHGTFEAGNKPLIKELVLSVQRLAVEALLPPVGPRGRAGQSQPAAGPASQESPGAGWFSGELTYKQKARNDLAGVLSLTGRLFDVDIGMVAVRLGRPGLSGLVSGTLDEAILDGRELRKARGRLRVDHLELAGVFDMFGLAGVDGSADLELHELRFEDDVLKAMLVAGDVRGLDLAPLLTQMGTGVITGRLNATVHKLKVVDGRLDELAGQVHVVPPGGADGTIDRAVLEALAEQVLNVPLSSALPEQLAYTDLGARFYGLQDLLQIEGVAGPGQKFILVADFSPMPLPLVPEPPGPIRLDRIQNSVAGQARQIWQGLLARAEKAFGIKGINRTGSPPGGRGP